MNITATNRLNYCAHVLAPGCFMHMCCKPLHRRGPSTLLAPPHVEIECGPERVEIKKKYIYIYVCVIGCCFVNKTHIKIDFTASRQQTTMKRSDKRLRFPSHCAVIQYFCEISLIFVLFSRFN